MAGPNPVAIPDLENLQGDLFSRGFPKYKETYYFFSIVPGKEQDFTKFLGQLGRSEQISSLKKVLGDWTAIQCTSKDYIIDITNALIAFTRAGLDRVGLHIQMASNQKTDWSRFNLACLMENHWGWTTSKSQILLLLGAWQKTARRI